MSDSEQFTEEMKFKSPFHIYREKYQPRMPKLLQAAELSVKTAPCPVDEGIKPLFPAMTQNPESVLFEQAPEQPDRINTPLRIGCVLSGGQAAGGHNVIVGLYEQIKRRNKNSQLFGFLEGPIGIIKGNYVELQDETISFYKNRGGFDMIRSGRDKIETPEQFQSSLKFCKGLKLDGLVVIGGDDSNTNACLLANYFKENGCDTKVIGCPKTIDGDLKNEYVEVSFGFDTACKTYSELIGNIMKDTLSTKKYYHFIRLMGRSASHIALECAMLTRPNYCYIGEEVQAKKVTLKDLVKELVEIIVKRSEQGMDYGVVLVPEGIVEFINEMGLLIQEINMILSNQLAGYTGSVDQLFEEVSQHLTKESAELLKYLPNNISEQLLLDRDPHGNVQVAKIESEQLLIFLCQKELDAKKQQGKYSGKFSTQCHYFGYEGRCAFPTNFDCDYCYNLGVNAAVLIEKGYTGLMSTLNKLYEEPENWVPGGYPLVTMMNVEIRHGKPKPVIKKALTELEGPLFKLFAEERPKWALGDYYNQIGPIQFEFPCQTPFLVKAPTLEDFYVYQEKTYKEKPFFAINPKYNVSQLTFARKEAEIKLPETLADAGSSVVVQNTLQFPSAEVKVACEKHYPFAFRTSNNLVEILDPSNILKASNVLQGKKGLKIGISFNGRQSPGGENIIYGLHKFCQSVGGSLIGFIGGSKGIFDNNAININDDNIEFYKNQGGFLFLGRTADKLRTQDELNKAKITCDAQKLDGLVLVGASHTCTDGLLLTNFFLEKQVSTKIVVIPSTIDGNVGHHMLECTVGFDSASKVYAQLIGNNMIDAASAVKYWYFMRLMGRDPSHLVLECALQTHPNITLISEEIQSNGWNLNDVVNNVCDVIDLRARKGKNFGTILIPEGLLAHLPEFKQLISELNNFFKEKSVEDQQAAANKMLNDNDFVNEMLSPWSAARFQTLPEFTQKQMVLERESSGGIQLSQIETEKLLSYLVEKELAKRKKEGTYKGKFAPVCHYFGYQGRCSLPSQFDCELASAYGYLAGKLISGGVTGYVTTARGVNGDVTKWQMGGIPLLNMTQIKAKSQFENIPIIPSNEVTLTSGAFQYFQKDKEHWKLQDYYSNPGPIQYFGERTNVRNFTLQLEHQNYLNHIQQIEQLTNKINSECRFGTHEDLLQITISHLKTLEQTLQTIKDKYNI